MGDNLHQRHFFDRAEKVQADDLFRPLRLGGNIANRQRRRIRRKDRMRRALLLDFTDHLLFQRQIFKHRFNDQIPMCKPAIIGRSGNQRQLAITLISLDMAATHLVIKQLPAVLQRMVDALSIDVFNTYRKFALGRGHEGDPPAHQAAA